MLGLCVRGSACECVLLLDQPNLFLPLGVVDQHRLVMRWAGRQAKQQPVHGRWPDRPRSLRAQLQFAACKGDSNTTKGPNARKGWTPDRSGAASRGAQVAEARWERGALRERANRSESINHRTTLIYPWCAGDPPGEF